MDFRKVLLLLLACGSSYAYTATKYFNPVDSETVNLGEWNKNCAAVIDKAKAENVPVVAVASQFGCAYCAALYTSTLNTQAFLNWCSSKPWYFAYAYSGTGNWGGTHPIYEILKLGPMPRVVGYWKKKNGTIVGGIGTEFAGRDKAATYGYITSYFEKLFADYSPNAADDWDPADDTEANATVLTPMVALQEHGTHTLSADSDQPDTADWFKMTVVADKRYRLGVSEWGLSAGSINVTVRYGQTTKTVSLEELAADPILISGYAGTVSICFRTSTSSSQGSYKLAYREFEEAVFSFEKAELTVNEDAGNVELKVLRTGRLTDSVYAVVSTTNLTAEAGVNYVAIANQQLTFKPGETEKPVTLKVKDIKGSQGDRDFLVSLRGEDTPDKTALTVTIKDLDVTTDASDPADDAKETATVLEMTDEASVLPEKHVLSPVDVDDWYSLGSVNEGETYLVKTTEYSARPKTSASPKVYLSIGGEQVGVLPLDGMAHKFVATKSGTLLADVKNETPESTGVYGYNLSWQHWVLPKVSLGGEKLVTTSGISRAVLVTRGLNLEEPLTVPVEVRSTDDRVASATNKVSFAAGVDTATLLVKVGLDDGFWAADEEVVIAILDTGVGKDYQLGDADTQTIVLKTQMPEMDPYDYTSVLETPQKRRTDVNATLNGSDTEDSFTIRVEAGVEYVFSISDVTASIEFDVPSSLSVSMSLPGKGKESVPLADCLGKSYHFTPEAAGDVLISVTKAKDAPVSLKYRLSYREWVPATIGFVKDSFIVSELASSVSIGVKCEMDVPVEVSVTVLTEDGTAVAGEDYKATRETLSWNETSSASSVQYVRIPLLKLANVYEGKSEKFKVRLDFSESDALDGEIAEATVQIEESDAGAIGSFVIDSFVIGTASASKYQTRSIAVTEGEKVTVNVKRVGGNAGQVVLDFAWNDGVKVGPLMFEDLEVEKSLELTIPSTEGSYVAKAVKRLSMTTAAKGVKLSHNYLTFAVSDLDKPLSEYRVERGNIPFAASGNDFYLDGGVIRSKTLVAGGRAVLNTTLKGEGTLRFTPVVTGSGTVSVKVGSQASVVLDKGKEAAVAVPAGTQRIVITFSASASGSCLTIEGESWIPGEAFYRVGTFNGFGKVLGGDVTATITVDARGRVSGRLTGSDKRTCSVSGNLSEGVKIRSGSMYIPDAEAEIVFDIDEAGAWTLSSGEELSLSGTRAGWADKPLTGLELENQDLLGTEPADVVLENGGVLTLKVSATGAVRMAGKVIKVDELTGKRIVRSLIQSQTMFFTQSEEGTAVPAVMFLDTLNWVGYLVEFK